MVWPPQKKSVKIMFLSEKYLYLHQILTNKLEP